MVSQLEQGQHFGEYGCLFGQPRSSTIVALEFSELYSLRKDSLMEVYAQWPELEREFLQMGAPAVPCHPPTHPCGCLACPAHGLRRLDAVPRDM